MPLTFMTSAAFNQNPSRAKRTADNGPLVITDHGERAYVLLRYEEFESRLHQPRSLAEALNDPDGSDTPFEPGRADIAARDVDFS